MTTATKPLDLTDEQIDEAALRRAIRDTARTAQDRPCGVRNGFARGLDPEGVRRFLGAVARGSWGGHGSDDEPEPDEGRKVGE